MADPLAPASIPAGMSAGASTSSSVQHAGIGPEIPVVGSIGPAGTKNFAHKCLGFMSWFFPRINE
jgi:hypothetical protein